MACNRPYSSPIYILDNDSLLNIFYLYRPVILADDENDDDRALEGGEWGRERWWHKLTHVCRRWRYLILGSASHLGLCLVCTYGTPVADMLAHSPPLPLVIDYVADDEYDAEYEEGLILALQFRDRVHRIRLHMCDWRLKKPITALDEEFSTLDYLDIAAQTKYYTGLMLPKSFQAPHLRRLVLDGVACPIGSPILTPTGLVTLSLIKTNPYSSINDLLQRLSLMPQLETLGIDLDTPVSKRDIERHSPVMTTHVALPNLRWFRFKGSSDYLEAFLPRMTTPILEKLQILFFSQATYPVPHLLQFITATENLAFHNARVTFDEEGVFVRVYPHEGAKMYALYIEVCCSDVGGQVPGAAQIFNQLRAIFSVVDYLTLESEMSFIRHPSRKFWPILRGQWRKILGSFNNVKVLRVGISNSFVWHLSRSLQVEEGESPLKLLPELKELLYFTFNDDGDAFMGFVEARRNVGHPVTLIGLIRRGTVRSGDPLGSETSTSSTSRPAFPDSSEPGGRSCLVACVSSR
jgi:hypothetical protein